MERPIELWNGVPEVGGICRLTQEKIAEKISAMADHENVKNLSVQIAAMIFKDLAQDCMPATDTKFKEYSCMSFDDTAVLQKYIEALNFKCAKWEE